MKNTKGFTLIELLAVIVILAIIALIATPMVLNTIDKAKEGAIKASAYNVISAVETQIATSMLENPSLSFKSWTSAAVSVKGTQVKSISLGISNGVVTSGTIYLENGYATIENGEVKTAKVSEYKDATSTSTSNSNSTDASV